MRSANTQRVCGAASATASARARLPTLHLLDPRAHPRELEDRVVAALGLAREHVARLDELARFWSDERTDPLVRLRDKFVVEAALLALIASRSRSTRLRAEATGLANDLSPHVRTEENRALLARDPHVATPLGLAHAALTLCGAPDPVFDKAVRRAYEAGLAFAAERLPYRSLEVHWIQSLLTRKRRAAPRHLIKASVTSARLDPMLLPVPEVYAITHVILFDSDFGRSRPSASLRRRDLRHALDALLAGFVASPNLDLIGELLLSRLIVGGVSPHVQVAWALLWDVWTTLGFVPSPGLNASEFAKLSGDAAAAYAVRHTYHSTFVAAMLAVHVLDTTTQLEDPPGHSPALRARLRRECRDPVAGRRTPAVGTTAPAKQTQTETSIWAAPRSRLDHVPPHAVDGVLADAEIVDAGRAADTERLAARMRAAVDEGRNATTLLEGAALLARL